MRHAIIEKTPYREMPYAVRLKSPANETVETFLFENHQYLDLFVTENVCWWIDSGDLSPYVRAFYRGRYAAVQDAADGWYCESPLSGEWAGESINEILGDIFVSLVNSDTEIHVCDEYLRGYEEYFSDNFPSLITAE